MPVIPRLADVSCKRMQFRPGDRVLVRTMYRLEPEDRQKLQRSVGRWVGCDGVEVLVYCVGDMQIDVEQR